MSDWSSFNEQKDLTDSWRSFLKERASEWARGFTGTPTKLKPPPSVPQGEPPPSVPQGEGEVTGEVSLAQLVAPVLSPGERGTAPKQLDSFKTGANVNAKLNHLIGKSVVTQLPEKLRAELEKFMTIDDLSAFLDKEFPSAEEGEVERFLGSVENRHIVAEHIFKMFLVGELKRIINEKVRS